jgi:hypothetical protein
MNAYLTHSKRFSHPKKALKFILALFAVVLFFCFSACNKQVDYLNYVSELRSNILLAQTENFSLRVFALEKETPYSADGVKRETNTLTELHLTAPTGAKTYSISFEVDGEKQGGEMSYDNVKGEYYFSCTLDIRAQTEIKFLLSSGSEQTELVAKSVLTETTLSPETALKTLVEKENELFTSLTDEYGFAGELHVRLIYEDNPYYYIGVTDRNGKTTAFLMSATTGKVLAKREN